MEEVLPSSVAEAEALAPEEIYAKKRGRDAEFLEGDIFTILACHALSCPAPPLSSLESPSRRHWLLARFKIRLKRFLTVALPS